MKLNSRNYKKKKKELACSKVLNSYSNCESPV